MNHNSQCLDLRNPSDLLAWLGFAPTPVTCHIVDGYCASRFYLND